MKIILTAMLFLITFFSIRGQTIYKDSIAPQIEFTDWINNPDGISVIKNKPVVLEFWSTWCGPCIKAIPRFNTLTEKYNKDITFISVNSYETKEVINKFLNKKHMSSFVALDEDQSLKNAFNVQNIPVTIIIDRKGMLRWRGITSELTDNTLNTFITQSRFNDNHKKSTILKKEFLVESLTNVNYQLEIEYGDATLGKGISTSPESEFHLKLKNYSVHSILNTLSDLFKIKDNWKFEGNLPETDVINLSIKSNIKLKEKLEAKELLNDLIFRLSELFNFEISQTEEMQTIWYIIPDSTQLEQYYSKNQGLDVKAIEITEEYIKYQNLFFDYLALLLSIRTKEKVKYKPLFTSGKYNLTIPKSNDIKEIKIYLKNKYGIDLVKKEEKVKMKTVTFN